MQILQTYNYNGAPIEFKLVDGEVYANATVMCQAFEKRPNDWMSLVATKRYIEAVTKKNGNAQIQLVLTKQGGDEQGTWVHEKLILKLAEWLDVEFEIWCDEKVAELLKNGSVALKPLTPAELVLQNAQVLVDHERRMSVMEQRQDSSDAKVAELEAKITTRPDYYAVTGYARLVREEMGKEKAQAYGLMASRLCRERGIPIEKVNDQKYGQVGAYPKSILIEVFAKMKPVNNTPSRERSSY